MNWFQTIPLFVWVAIIASIFIIIIISYAYSIIYDRNQDIEELKKKLNEFQRKKSAEPVSQQGGPAPAAENRRMSFRLDLAEEPCKLTLLDYSQADIVQESKLVVQMKDISIGGMNLECRDDLPINKDVSLELQFTLRDEQFVMKGKLVRKVQSLHNPEISYGAQFLDVDPKEEKRLFSILHLIETERKK